MRTMSNSVASFASLQAVAKVVLAAVLLTACAPKIYVMDRQTVLEEEAAGKWPELDAQLGKKTTAGLPAPFEQVPESKSQSRIYRTLNSEMLAKAAGGTALTEKGAAQKPAAVEATKTGTKK